MGQTATTHARHCNVLHWHHVPDATNWKTKCALLWAKRLNPHDAPANNLHLLTCSATRRFVPGAHMSTQQALLGLLSRTQLVAGPNDATQFGIGWECNAFTRPLHNYLAVTQGTLTSRPSERQLTIKFLNINYNFESLILMHFYVGFIILSIAGENFAYLKEPTGTIFIDPLNLFWNKYSCHKELGSNK